MRFKTIVRRFLQDHFLSFVINRDWQREFGYKIDWNNPKDINEKMQWLLCFGDTSLWHTCADKLKVHSFLKERNLDGLLVDLYGSWDSPEKINYDNLPEKFVLKCNHDSGTCFIIDKNNYFNKADIHNTLREALKRKFGYVHSEMFYNKIKPCIIAEEFLEDNNCDFSSTLVDYKFWCFDGNPYCVWTCYDREQGHAYVNVYDMEWNVHPEHSVFTDHYRDGKGIVPKPKTFEQMKSAASILSKGFPEVRVDFYEVNGKLYFGELTFMTLYGQIDFYTKNFLKELGDQCRLPIDTKK